MHFQDENAQVQLQLLTATVKLFLKRPSEAQEMVQQVLGLATQDSDNPDLRDRGFIYWRLLSIDPAAARKEFTRKCSIPSLCHFPLNLFLTHNSVNPNSITIQPISLHYRDVVLAERPLIDVECDSIEPTLLDTLVSHIATVASVSYLPPVPVARPGLVHEEDIEEYRSVPSELDLEKIQEGNTSDMLLFSCSGDFQ